MEEQPKKKPVSSVLTVIVVDDEKLARDELTFLLKSVSDVEVVGTATNGLEAIECIETNTPNLVFMDVQMPGLDGLSAAKRVINAGGDSPHFVFATAYDQYAIEAFEVNAVDYLLKPVEKGRLAESIARTKKRLEAPQSPDHLEQLLNHVGTPKNISPNKIVIKSANRMFLIDAQDVIYAFTQDGLIRIVTNQVEGQASYKTIEGLQAVLIAPDFWRPHRSYLVNVNKIREVIPWFKSTYQLRMSDRNQTEIPVSRAQTKRLRELFKI